MSPMAGDWVAWVGSYGDIGTGGEGDYRVRLKDNTHRWDCAYPGVEVLPDGTFVTTTYGLASQSRRLLTWTPGHLAPARGAWSGPRVDEEQEAQRSVRGA